MAEPIEDTPSMDAPEREQPRQYGKAGDIARLRTGTGPWMVVTSMNAEGAVQLAYEVSGELRMAVLPYEALEWREDWLRRINEIDLDDDILDPDVMDDDLAPATLTEQLRAMMTVLQHVKDRI